jgi:hypothetical protein
MSALLRDFLLASGVSPGDIRKAVGESRRLVEQVERWSGVAETAGRHVREKAKRESVQKGAGLVELAAGFVGDKAREMLGRGKPR